MTHVVHPYAHRIGILRDWQSRWFSKTPKEYRDFLRVDTIIREYLEKRLRGMYVNEVLFERYQKNFRIIIRTSRPGMIIGREGSGAALLKNDIVREISALGLSEMPELKVDVEEVRSPESHAGIVVSMIVEALEKRMPHRRVLKQTIEKVMANRDVEGARIIVSGRLGGAEMSRTEKIKQGRVPLTTFRADIDFARGTARLPYGVIGVKVWIYRGDIFVK